MMRDSLLLILLAAGCSNAFVVHKNARWSLTPQVASLSRLAGYRDDWGSGGGSSPANKSTKTRKQHIPLLGPIPGDPPLLLGGEMFLDPPTPLQWQTLEESVLLHQQYLKEQLSTTETEAYAGNERSTAAAMPYKTTGVDAAPLVAVIDDVTGKGTSGRYATLAAVVGISSSNKSVGLDTSDETSFMESLSQIGTVQSPLNSRIRLVGVGRASLKEFFYKLPTKLEDDDDEENSVEEEELAQVDGEDVDHDELGMGTVTEDYGEDYDGNIVMEHHRDDDEEEQETPIVMAEFKIIRDSPISSTARSSQLGNKGARSVHCSPVHALAEMSKVVNRVIYLHDDRRRLVKGLKAAKIRLEQANVFEDHDGIGEVTAKDESDQEIIEEFLTKYDHGVVQPSSLDTSAIASMENYGLNYYSAFSAIPQLATVALQSFEPYYSPEVHRSEEHEMEVTSFVAFRALDGFCSPQDLAWALQCTNTIERFNAAYDLMWRHKALLEKMAAYTSQDLRDCGEECTDLW